MLAITSAQLTGFILVIVPLVLVPIILFGRKVKKLGKKLTDLMPDQELIHSVYGAGYRYDPQERIIG